MNATDTRSGYIRGRSAATTMVKTHLPPLRQDHCLCGAVVSRRKEASAQITRRKTSDPSLCGPEDIVDIRVRLLSRMVNMMLNVAWREDKRSKSMPSATMIRSLWTMNNGVAVSNSAGTLTTRSQSHEAGIGIRQVGHIALLSKR